MGFQRVRSSASARTHPPGAIRFPAGAATTARHSRQASKEPLMDKTRIVVTVLGADRCGIVAAVLSAKPQKA